MADIEKNLDKVCTQMNEIFKNLELPEHQMTDVVKYPDLMIYLRSSVPHLVKNIQKRGRDYEQQIPLEYLENLNELYEEFIYKNYGGKVMTIDVNNIDYEHQPRQFGEIIDRIDADLFGLFK